MATRFPLLPLAAAALLQACAAQGPFPSLAPRAIERELAGTPLPPCAAAAAEGCADADRTEPERIAPPADDPQLAVRLDALLRQAREGDQAFRAALPGANRAVRRAGAAQSESWIAAQLEISGLEAARALTTDALAEAEGLQLARSETGPASEADRQRLQNAAEELRRLAEAQRLELERLNAALSAP